MKCLGVVLLAGGSEAGVEGREEMIVLASGYIFRKGDSLWFLRRMWIREPRAAEVRGTLVLSLSLSSPIQVP